MPTPKNDRDVSALQAIYAALKPLDDAERSRVLVSVQALLGMAEVTTETRLPLMSAGVQSGSTRPMSLVELIKDKQPKTNIDLITLFAYYRDQFEGQSRFGRNDLRAYFSKAKQNPPGNFDRDFVEAVKRGWLHEDGHDSYITSRGIEAIASGFPAERRSTKGKNVKGRKARKSPSRRKPAAKR